MDAPRHWQELPGAPAAGTRVGTAASMADGEGRLILLGEADTTFGLIVFRDGDIWHAYANRCPHFGVPLAHHPHQLICARGASVTCNVHYSRFDWRNGRCLKGECLGDALLPVPVRAADGWLVIAG